MRSITAEDPAWIGPYRILGRLGEGGMGRVYLARSEGGRTVAVKLILRELAQDAEFRQRFAQEVSAAQRVGGRWTAPVLDADTRAVMPWVATGYIPGPSLTEVVEKDHGPLPEASVRALASGLSQALAAIHSVGLVHRDLKPSNILVTVDGPRVIDFGIARALDAQGATGDVRTRTGAVVGSPGFMSPEQVRGQSITPASDVFCLGAVLAYAATGRTPFGGADSGLHSVLYRIAQEEPDLTGVPPKLAGLVRACLIKDPAGRPSVAELVEATRDAEPAGAWLPGALLAQLGQRAARLLDAEAPAARVAQHPAPPPLAMPGPSPYGPTALASTPPPVPHNPYAPGPLMTAPPLVHGPTPPPPVRSGPSGGRVALIVLASVGGTILAVLILLIVIGIVYGDDEETPAEPKGDVPRSLVGAWEGVLDDGSGERIHGRFRVTQGVRGALVATVVSSGGDSSCEGRSPLASANATSIVLGEGRLTRSLPAAESDSLGCVAPPRQTLLVQPDGSVEWRVGTLSTILSDAETGEAVVHPKFLGTWNLRADRADDRLRLTIDQGAVGDKVVTATGSGKYKNCTWTSVLVGAQADRLVLSPFESGRSGCPVRGTLLITPAGDDKMYVEGIGESEGSERREMVRVAS
ncbi:protein kinase [Streptomyces coeruleoprunus]|uniref:Protein kinase n=1 Tax=Streptomyces coeruleoprunus TaxID=285563 RepID=A0ABV9X996_9ACTN